jgi:hypothetical protein
VADPVSWLLIEPGWKVLAADGSEVGRVEDVAGDSGNDIFNGLSVATGMFARPRYVPAEQVAEIVEGTVRLSIGRDALEGLGEYEEPPSSARVRPDTDSLRERRRDEPRSVPITRRVARWFGLGGRR